MAFIPLGALVFVGGCNKEGAANAGTPGNANPKTAGTVGFVDLDRLYAQINWKSEFENDLKAAQAETGRQLKVYLDAITLAWENKKKEIAAAARLTPEQVNTLNSPNAADIQKLPLAPAQRDEFFQCFNQANNELSRAKQLADQVYTQRENGIRNSLREAIKPSVRKVALSDNISMVITPASNESLIFYAEPSVDLTDKVVDDLRKAMPQHAMPEMPKLGLPTDFHFRPTPTTGTISPAPATTAPSTGR